MLQLRYNGCPDCLRSAQTILTGLGYFKGRDYTVEFHKEHKDDAIYKARPDYIKEFSGAILYNPDSGHWIDFYNNDHTKLVFGAIVEGEDSAKTKERNRALYLALKNGA